MSDPRSRILDDGSLSKVNGGYLPDGWKESVRSSIVSFLKMSDEELKAYGCSRNVDSLIATMDDEFQKQEGLTDEEMVQVKQFVRDNYGPIEASLK